MAHLAGSAIQIAALPFTLIGWHFIADFPLQGSYLSSVKCLKDGKDWPLYMLAHCWIQGLGVYLLTGSLILGVLEIVVHFFIDVMKCKGRLNIWDDQIAHIICKIVWCYMMPWILTLPKGW